MLSAQQIASLCEQLGSSLDAGEGLRHRAIDAATALFLAISSLERAVGYHQLPPHAAEDLERARALLHGIQAVAHTAAEQELRRDVLEARRLILAATSNLLGDAP